MFLGRYVKIWVRTIKQYNDVSGTLPDVNPCPVICKGTSLLVGNTQWNSSGWSGIGLQLTSKWKTVHMGQHVNRIYIKGLWEFVLCSQHFSEFEIVSQWKSYKRLSLWIPPLSTPSYPSGTGTCSGDSGCDRRKGWSWRSHSGGCGGRAPGEW